MAKEEIEIVIVGGGICGLALAVALQKKGVKSLVLERSETLRSAGAGIAILTNGWRALDQLGVGYKLREFSTYAVNRVVDIDLEREKQNVTSIGSGEARAVKRSELIKALAEELPPEAIRYGCQVVSVVVDDDTTNTTTTTLQLSTGGSIRAKVVVGCDGANSVIDGYLNLKPKKAFSLSAVRGFTAYPNGHNFGPELVRIRKGSTMSGRVAIDDKLVFWFVVQKSFPKDSRVAHDHPQLIKQFSLEAIQGIFPEERIEVVKNSDLDSLSLTHLRYRAPWDLLFEKFRRGNVTVAGDAMHVMGPFLGQGGSAAIEDAVVLARCLTKNGRHLATMGGSEVDEALDDYIRERRMRLLKLSTQTYLTGKLLEAAASNSPSSLILKALIIILLMSFFRDPMKHTRYDCGEL